TSVLGAGRRRGGRSRQDRYRIRRLPAMTRRMGRVVTRLADGAGTTRRGRVPAASPAGTCKDMVIIARSRRGSAGRSGASAEAHRHAWPYGAGAWVVDQTSARELAQGTDMVVNLAAGLDARPYRMELPPALRWIEIDLPAMVQYKEEVLAGERPRCALERVP